jgi:hypothetical protein
MIVLEPKKERVNYQFSRFVENSTFPKDSPDMQVFTWLGVVKKMKLSGVLSDAVTNEQQVRS